MGIFDNFRNGTSNTLANALLGRQAANNSLPATQANEALTDYQNYLRQSGYSDDVVNGVSQGLNNGDKNIADWISQYNNGVGKQTPINIPQTQEEIGLAKQGLFNAPQLMGSASESPRIGGLFPDLVNGYRENYNNNFSPSNWGNNTLSDGRNKGFAYKTGEFLGSVGKFIDSPMDRGLMAAGLNKALGYDDSLQEGLTAYIGRQGNIAADRLYRDALQKQGIDTSGIRGNLTSDMYNNVAKNTTSAQRAQNQLTIASLKDNTSRARLIGNWVKTGIITPEEASSLSNVFGITDADFQASNETRKTDSQIALNEARIENINNPKPKVYKTIREGHTIVDINHNGGSGKTNSNKGNGKPIGANNNGLVRIQAPNGTIKLIPKNAVSAAVANGGKVL